MGTFNITFVDGKTYDLEGIIFKRKRMNPDSPLVMEVKKDSEICQEVYEDLKNSIKSTLLADEVKAEINTIIRNAMASYGFKESVYPYIKDNVTKYLEKLLRTTRINFTIEIEGNSVNINYDFFSEETMLEELKDYYKKFRRKYIDKINNVKQGGLAILDRSSETKVKVTKDDYMKYLFKDSYRDKQRYKYKNTETCDTMESDIFLNLIEEVINNGK